MRVVVVQGSPRAGGNTARLVGLFAEELARSAAPAGNLELEIVDLARRRVEPCLGCRLCFDRGEAACPRKDDVLTIFRSIAAADALVLASPVYVDDASGLMKNWIDRMAWLCHRPSLGGKLSFVVTTAGSAASPHAVGTMAMAARLWGCLGSGSLSVIAGGTLAHGGQERFRAAAARAAARLWRAHASGSARKQRFVPMLVESVQRLYWRRFADDSYDCAWWRERTSGGAMEGRAPIRRGLARLLGALVAAIIFPPSQPRAEAQKAAPIKKD